VAYCDVSHPSGTPKSMASTELVMSQWIMGNYKEKCDTAYAKMNKE
jgi:hypothetical protein